MKFKFDKPTLLKIACLIILFVAIALGAVELLFLVDLGGIDFAVTFLLVYFASLRDSLIYKYRVLKSDFEKTITFLSELYIFQPKVFVSHASASAVLITLTSSVLLACLMWIPLIYISSVFVG
ncbi:MAG: hypothetical protein GKR91_12520 [Pseudomonadales bacterium]|nr:hypothetical protein [Pseudomonadales bacterium]